MRGAAAAVAFGLLEVGYGISAHGNLLKVPVEVALALILPTCLYVLLGAIAFATPLGRLVPPAVPVVLGAAWLTRAYWKLLGSFHWLPAVIGAVLAIAVLWTSRRMSASSRTLAGVAIAWVAVVASCFVAVLSLERPDLPASGPPKTPVRDGLPHVVLVTWDTVRADMLPPYGGRGLDTPALDRLAAEGVLFESCQAVAPITGPSHASMLTGLYPFTHGLRSNGYATAKSEIPRLPQILAASGYATGGFVSGFSVRGRFGFDIGMDVFVDAPAADPWMSFFGFLHRGSMFMRRKFPQSHTARATQTPGDVTLERALSWYRGTQGPTFLWTHFYDAHFPYDPAEPHLSRVSARASEPPLAVSDEGHPHLVLQRGEVQELDHLLAKLREGLEAKDPGLRNTIVVLVSDHGECFGEGGLLHSHHESLFAATQRIPLVMRWPGGPSGQRVRSAASHVDLLPTICELLGLAVPPGMQGTSLVSVARGEEAPSRGIYMEAWQADLGNRRMAGWWRDGFKFVRDRRGNETLYASAEVDVDVTASDPKRLSAMASELDEYLSSEREAVGEQTLTDEDREALKALGYIGD